MIRRKLTRLEVTLDDTKELDELFSSTKCNQITHLAQTTTTPNTLSTTQTKQVTTSLLQKHLLLGKQGSELSEATCSVTTDTPIVKSSSDEPPILIGANLTQTSTTGISEAIIDTSASEPTQLGYNPQPHQPSNRFQIKPDTTQ